MQSVWRAPGRINLIGEHTDYNDGFALPFGIDAGCTASVRRRGDGQLIARSAQYDTPAEAALAELRPGRGGWSGYVLGVAWALRGRGHNTSGLDIEVDSTVPVGSGLSSSAALVCSVTSAVDDALGLGLDPDELLAVTRSVENDFVGAPTGGMDQLASLRCRAGHALLCDMRTLDTEQVPLEFGAAGLTMLVIDSRAEHRHADGAYRERREGCERAAAQLGVDALRDISVDGLDDALRRLDADDLRRYVRHIVTENARVLQAVELLRAGDVASIGPLLTASHVSMRDDYRITVAEIDLAVETLLEAGAVGARMTGGGFGGCVIALIDAHRVDAAVDRVRGHYRRHGFADPGHFTVSSPAAGAHRLEVLR